MTGNHNIQHQVNSKIQQTISNRSKLHQKPDNKKTKRAEIAIETLTAKVRFF